MNAPPSERSDPVPPAAAGALHLLTPALEQLAGYTAALRRGWYPDTHQPESALDELQRIALNPALFLAQQVDRHGRGPPVRLPDGRRVPRLPGYTLWLWDGEFCGTIRFRWQPGTTRLPVYCLGHIGYSVVPWKRRQGYATRALHLLLERIDEPGLNHVCLVTEAANHASRRVITANGGEPVDMAWDAPVAAADIITYRIPLPRG